MAKKVSEYTTAATVFASGDLFDLTKLVSTGPDVYESQKANANLLAGWNLFGQDQTMPAPRLHNLSNNQLSLTNGRLLLKGSDNIGTDLLKLESLAGTEVFKALNNGTIKISNAFTLPVADGTAGQALLTDGAGAVSFGNVATSSIYSADGTVSADRIVSLNSNTLIFNPTTGATTDLLGCNVSIKTPTGVMGVSNNGTNTFTIFDVNDNSLWIFKDNGNAVCENGKLAIGVGSNLYSSDFIVRGKTIFQAKNAGSAFFGGWAQSNGANITAMYEDGKMVFGDSSPIGSEKISIQGHTIIKGAGTTTGTTLALFDNQGTPAKTWEWLDNGSVNIGQDSVFNLNTHKLEFKDSTGANSLLILDDNTRSKISSTNSSTFMQYAGSSTTGKMTVTSSAVTVNSAFFQSKNEAGTHIALDINNNSTNGKISINNSVGTQMEWTNDKVGITSSATRIVRNNVIRAFFADAFTIFGSDNTTTINGEDISLQGDVLMNANVNMSNLPTSATGLSSGDIYNDGGTLKIV